VTYFVAMVFCGIPIFFQEVAIGQYLGSGGMTLVGKLCPILSGKNFTSLHNNKSIFIIQFFIPAVLLLINITSALICIYILCCIGTGYATMTIVFLLDVYYCVIVAWTFFYLASCFISFPTLPWESCSKIH